MATRIGILLLFMLSTTWSSHARQLSELHPEDFAAQALDYRSDNKTQTEVLKQLHESCSRVPTFKQQMDIIEMLMNLCNPMEKKYVKKCKGMVFKYRPLVLANAEQFLETKDLCTVLHEYRSQAISAQESSSEITIGLSES